MTDTIERALNVVERQRPCGHENHNAQLGNGRVWAKCEDCGATFDRETLPDRHRAVQKFDDAIDVLRKAAMKGAKRR